MFLYNISTDDYFKHSDEGGVHVRFSRGAVQNTLMHEKEFSYTEFEQHIKEAYRESMKKAPDGLRCTANGQPLNVSFEHVVEAMCTLHGYNTINTAHSYNLEMEAQYEEHGEPTERVYMKNILIEEKEAKKEEWRNEGKDDLDDNFFKEFDEFLKTL